MKFLIRWCEMWYEHRFERLYQQSLDEADEIIQDATRREAEEKVRLDKEKVRQAAIKAYDQCVEGLAHDRALMTQERALSLASIAADNYLYKMSYKRLFLQESEVRDLFFEVFEQNERRKDQR